MKYMFYVLAYLSISMGAASQSFQDRSPQERAEYFTRKMVHDLSLHDSLIPKIYTLNLRISFMFDSLYKQGKKTDTRKGAAQIYQFRNEELQNILTRKQYLQFDDMERERREAKQKEKEKEKGIEKVRGIEKGNESEQKEIKIPPTPEVINQIQSTDSTKLLEVSETKVEQ